MLGTQHIPGDLDEKIYDFFCVVSSHTSIPPDAIYANGTQCAYGGEPLLLDHIALAQIAASWTQLQDIPGRVVGTGDYTEYWLQTIGRAYTRVEGGYEQLLLVQLSDGEKAETVRDSVLLGTRSLRQSGGVISYNKGLHDYWSAFRPVTFSSRFLHVSHVSESELAESKARLDAGLVPYRRYNTPLIRRRPGEVNLIASTDRAKCKWMALEIINGARMIVNLGKITEDEIMVDNRGILRVPISSPQEENAFASIWLKVNTLWDNIVRVEEVKYTQHIDGRLIPYRSKLGDVTKEVVQLAPYPIFEETPNDIVPIEDSEEVIKHTRRDIITIDGSKLIVVVRD
jgi:hypothetical protein